MSRAMYGDAFDRLFARGRDAVLSGAHYCDTPPVDGGRWGISVILRPDVDCTRKLGAITAEAMEVAGGGHWPTGSEAAVHLTVRALEPHRAAVPDDDPTVARYAAALERAARVSRPVRLRVGGLPPPPVTAVRDHGLRLSDRHRRRRLRRRCR